MRVIAGIYRSRTLRSLKGQDLRPTSDRLRETLFNIIGPDLPGSTFVDLYAGTGAVGIEALSRGALLAMFVERHEPAANLIQRNLESLGVGDEAEILIVDVLRALKRLEARRVRPQFIYLDPPYTLQDEYERTLAYLSNSPLAIPGGRIIAEHFKKYKLPDSFGGLELARRVEQGDAALSFYKLVKVE